jgi:hypothetical protein
MAAGFGKQESDVKSGVLPACGRLRAFPDCRTISKCVQLAGQAWNGNCRA